MLFSARLIYVFWYYPFLILKKDGFATATILVTIQLFQTKSCLPIFVLPKTSAILHINEKKLTKLQKSFFL
jgi:hypothetical protein